jgi:hypothetical protein
MRLINFSFSIKLVIKNNHTSFKNITFPPPPGGTAILPEYIHYYGYYYQVIYVVIKKQSYFFLNIIFFALYTVMNYITVLKIVQ